MKTLPLFALALLAGCSGPLFGDDETSARAPGAHASLVDDDAAELDDDDEDEDDETPIPLDEVPDHVLAAARAALAGFEPTEAELDRESGQEVYDLEGTVGDEVWEVEVLPDGTVVEVERDD